MPSLFHPAFKHRLIHKSTDQLGSEVQATGVLAQFTTHFHPQRILDEISLRNLIGFDFQIEFGQTTLCTIEKSLHVRNALVNHMPTCAIEKEGELEREKDFKTYLLIQFLYQIKNIKLKTIPKNILSTIEYNRQRECHINATN